MKKLILLFLPLLFINCKKETSREDTHGTNLVRVVKHVDNARLESEYSYNEDGKISEVFTIDDSGDSWKSLFTYSNGFLQIFSQEFQSDFDKDSILWSTQEKFDRVYKFEGRDAESTRLKTVETYRYNMAGDSIEKVSRDYVTDTIIKVEFYIVEDGNVIQIDRFNSNGNLSYQYFFENDNYPNYERERNYAGISPFIFNKNNMTRYEIKKINGDYGSPRNPMNFQYKYNLDGYPIELSNDFSEKWEMFYE
jgi:hypothetical protein